MNLATMVAKVYELTGSDLGGISDYGVIGKLNDAQRAVGQRIRTGRPEVGITQWDTDLLTASPPAYTLPTDFMVERVVRLQGNRADPLSIHDEPDTFDGYWYRIIGNQILVSMVVPATVTDGLFIEYESSLYVEMTDAAVECSLPAALHALVVATAANMLTPDGPLAGLNMAAENAHFDQWMSVAVPVASWQGGGWSS